MFSDADWHKRITWNAGAECGHQEEEERGNTVDRCHCEFGYYSNFLREASLIRMPDSFETTLDVFHPSEGSEPKTISSLSKID